MGLTNAITTPQTGCDLKSTDQPNDGPLSGFRALDLSSVVSGSMAAVVLADQRVDVIKIQPPGWGGGIRGLGTDCRQYAADDLVELLAYNEIPAGRVNTWAQVMDDPQVQAT